MHKGKKRFHIHGFFPCVLFEHKIYVLCRNISFLMETKHCPFDTDILKAVSYPNSTDQTMSLWTYCHYPSDTMSQKIR